jgi:hypothetical protein
MAPSNCPWIAAAAARSSLMIRSATRAVSRSPSRSATRLSCSYPPISRCSKAKAKPASFAGVSGCRAKNAALAHPSLLALRLDQVVAERARELRIARDLGGRSQLPERLLLDRMNVGQILGELFVEGVWHRSS